MQKFIFTTYNYSISFLVIVHRKGAKCAKLLFFRNFIVELFIEKSKKFCAYYIFKGIDGRVNLFFTMNRRYKNCLKLGRGKIKPSFQHAMKERCIPLGIALLGSGIIRNRGIGKKRTQHRAYTSVARRNLSILA